METGGAQLGVSMSNTEKREILPEDNCFLSKNAQMRCDTRTGQQKETNFPVAPVQDLQDHHTITLPARWPGTSWLHPSSSLQSKAACK